MDYFNKISIIFILVIVSGILLFYLIKPFIKTKNELFYVDNINLRFSGGQQFKDLFIENLKNEKIKEEGFLGEIPKKIAQEKYLNHLKKIKDGYFDYNRFFDKGQIIAPTETPSNLKEENLTTESPDLKFNFI